MGALMCLPVSVEDNLDKPAIIPCQSGRAHMMRAGSRAFPVRAGKRTGSAGLPARGQRSPVVLSGAWYTAGELEGGLRSQRGAGDNARNGPLCFGVRQARS